MGGEGAAGALALPLYTLFAFIKSCLSPFRVTVSSHHHSSASILWICHRLFPISTQSQAIDYQPRMTLKRTHARIKSRFSFHCLTQIGRIWAPF